MRYLISAVLLLVAVVGWQRSSFAQAAVSGTVVEGQEFYLGWPQGAPKAFIRIPASAIGSGPGKVRPTTQITISLITESSESIDHPKRFKDHWERTGKKVFPPIVAFSFDPYFTITEQEDYFLIGMCVQYHPSDTAQFNRARLMRAPLAGTTLEALPIPALPSELCALRKGAGCRPGPPHCPNDPGLDPNDGASASYLHRLLEGSPFSPTPLYALPEPEGGLGGKGGSGSPFAAVEQ